MGLVRKALIGAVLSVLLYQILHALLYDAYVVWRFAPTRETTAGKRVLITGSSKGIGRELAALYSELGAHVTLHGRSAEALAKVAENCAQNGAASVHTAVGDMSKVGEAEKTVKSAAEAMGGLDIVIVNHISTYVFENLHSAVSRIRSGELQRDLQVDLFSYAETAQAAIPFLESSSGSIVLVSSAAGLFPMPYFYAYGFAKRSLEGLALALRQELALNGSSVHAGIAFLGAIDTPSARDTLPRVYSGPIYYASLRETVVAIATVASGRLTQLLTPPAMKPFYLLNKFFPEYGEERIRKVFHRL